ncbi:MAG: hypothetical protein JJU29_08940 [Verrucomicrobia bacterium]|nr:hypothetical protein [Verrucomicrobiota bacterium]MCH8511396.1 hypothetical protein [Kiritimatiellia bacterium]
MTKEKDAFKEFPWLTRDGNYVRINFDMMPAHMEEETRKALTEYNGVPTFTGEVKNGYPLTAVKDPSVCPCCGASTEEQTAEFIYATSAGMRLMLVPGGWFCGSCPTVIVDEQLIARGMVVKARFRRVVGVINDKTRDPMYFATWRGEKSVFIIDEDEQIEDLITESEMNAMHKSGPPSPAPSIKKERKKKKAKRKQASKARKQNKKR